MPYEKNKMLFEDYTWLTNRAGFTEADFESSGCLLNRRDGYEMLCFINYLAKCFEWKNVHLASYRNLEKIIRDEVPFEIKMAADVKQWILTHHWVI